MSDLHRKTKALINGDGIYASFSNATCLENAGQTNQDILKILVENDLQNLHRESIQKNNSRR